MSTIHRFLDSEQLHADAHGPLVGALFMLHKAHTELVGHAASMTRRQQVITRGDAREYAREILALLRAERERRRQARRDARRGR